MRGFVTYLFAFDVASEVMTRDVRQILGISATPLELRTAPGVSRDFAHGRPLMIEAPGEMRVRGELVRVAVHVFEVGVVSISMRVPVTVESLQELYVWHQPKSDAGEPLEVVARRLCTEVCASMRDSLVQMNVPSASEAYTVFCLTDLGAEENVEAWFALRQREVAGLLSETPGDLLSSEQVAESVRIRRSFTARDLVVIDWDASLVVDLDGYFDDTVYVLELANLQLEEFRVMDERLDRHLERAYRDLERARSFGTGTPRGVLHWLRRFRVDVTKLADEVSHFTKFFGDWYLARVYAGASERFHLRQWQASVQERLGQLDEVYRVIQSDAYERRMLWLEIAVVVCFIVDLLAIFFWKN